jgi:hypothetical protein
MAGVRRSCPVATTPEHRLNVTVQPLVFDSLFTYAFGGGVMIADRAN